MHPVCFSKLKKREKTSKKSEKISTQTYASNEHSWKISTGNKNFAPFAKKTKSVAEMRFKNTFFLTRICLFCTGHKNCYFLSKFFTSVHYLYMFVSNCFQIFSKYFHIFLILKNIPGEPKRNHTTICTEIPFSFWAPTPPLLKKNRIFTSEKM